jgi:hypothetical protein
MLAVPLPDPTVAAGLPLGDAAAPQPAGNVETDPLAGAFAAALAGILAAAVPQAASTTGVPAPGDGPGAVDAGAVDGEAEAVEGEAIASLGGAVAPVASAAVAGVASLASGPPSAATPAFAGSGAPVIPAPPPPPAAAAGAVPIEVSTDPEADLKPPAAPPLPAAAALSEAGAGEPLATAGKGAAPVTAVAPVVATDARQATTARGDEGDGGAKAPGDPARHGEVKPVEGRASGASAAPDRQPAGEQAFDDSGGRELGGREIRGEVVVKAGTSGAGHGETFEPRRAGGGDPSAPSPLPPSPARDAAPAVRPNVVPPAPGAAADEVERLLRLDALRPARLRDGGEMRIEVRPEGLGKVEIRVAVHESGVHANLYADDEHTRHSLEQGRPTLAAALERSQLRLDGFSVGAHADRDGAAWSRDGEPGGRPGSFHAALTGAPAPAVAAHAIEPARSASGLSLRI